MKAEKLAKVMGEMKDSLKKRGAELSEFRKADSGIPAVASSAISVGTASVLGFAEGYIAGNDAPTHLLTAAAAGIGGATAVLGAVLGHPTVARIGLDLGTGPAAALAYVKSMKWGVAQKLAKLVADSTKKAA